jgi:hypothetical protein
VAGCFEHFNEISGSIKGEEFLDQLNETNRACTIHATAGEMKTVIKNFIRMSDVQDDITLK